MKFSTKVDWWIGAAIALAPIAMIGAAIASRSIWVFVGGFIYMGLLSLILFPCEYVFESKNLVVRSGLIRWRIPFNEIDEVKPTRNPLSSPAWSLDRLWISYGKRNVMVSPREKKKFLEAIAQRAGLKASDGKWVREGKG